MNPPFVLCLQSRPHPPSIVSCVLRPFYSGERGFGCDGGSAGEAVAVAVMVVVVAAGKGWRGGVTCWTAFLCSCGGWCRLRGGWRAERDHHCIAGHHEWPIVRRFAVSASLCCCSISLREKHGERKRSGDAAISTYFKGEILKTEEK